MNDATYYLHTTGGRIGLLSDPRQVDHRWWDYRVEPTSIEAQGVLRDPSLWGTSDFTIVDDAGNQPNPGTLAGECELFCDGSTDRMTFLALCPPRPKQRAWSRSFWFWALVIVLLWLLCWM